MEISAIDCQQSLATELIAGWMEGHPSRNLSTLARVTGIPKSEISAIMNGRTPSFGNTIRLGTVLPADRVMELLCDTHSDFREIFFRFMSS